MWTADILLTMGRYAQAALLACHAIDLCKKSKLNDLSKEPLKYAPKECIESIFPRDNKTPEDLVTNETALKLIQEAKECLGL